MSPSYLLICASHVVVPVHEVALRVVPPRPDVKLEERRQVESVWAVDEQEYLTLQNGGTRVVLQPSCGVCWLLNEAPVERISDHAPITIDLPLTRKPKVHSE